MLCFVMSRYNKLDLKYIRDITIGFYNADEVNAAKKQLLTDAKDMKLDSRLSRYPERQGDGRVSREVDDILSNCTTTRRVYVYSLFTMLCY